MLIELIKTVEDYENKSVAAITAELNDSTIEIRDDQQYTWAGVALLAGPAAAETLRIALEGNGMGWAVHQFGGSGLSLTDPQVRGAITQFIQLGNSESAYAALADLQVILDVTISYISVAQKQLQADVTEAEVTAALTEESELLRDAANDSFITAKLQQVEAAMRLESTDPVSTETTIKSAGAAELA